MFSNRTRLALALASAALGAWLVWTGLASGWGLLLAAALFAHGHFRNGPVWLAFQAARSGRLERAAELLAEVRHPEQLSSPMRAYYELLSADLAEHGGHLEQAEQHLRLARQHRLRTDHDRAVAEGNLARLLAARGEDAEARDLLASARARSHRAGELLDRVEASLEGPPAG